MQRNAILWTPKKNKSEKDESRVFKANENRPLEKGFLKPLFSGAKMLISERLSGFDIDP